MSSSNCQLSPLPPIPQSWYKMGLHLSGSFIQAAWQQVQLQRALHVERLDYLETRSPEIAFLSSLVQHFNISVVLSYGFSRLFGFFSFMHHTFLFNCLITPPHTNRIIPNTILRHFLVHLHCAIAPTWCIRHLLFSTLHTVHMCFSPPSNTPQSPAVIYTSQLLFQRT